MNFRFIWHFLIGACELIQILICKGKNCSNYAEWIRFLRVFFSYLILAAEVKKTVHFLIKF